MKKWRISNVEEDDQWNQTQIRGEADELDDDFPITLEDASLANVPPCVARLPVCRDRPMKLDEFRD